MLASPSEDKTIRVWDSETGVCLHVLEGHRTEVVSVAFDPAGRILASGAGGEISGDPGELMLWKTTTWTLLGSLTGHSGPVNVVSFHPNGQILASAGVDGQIGLWSLTNNKLIRFLKGHDSYVDDLEFNLQGNILASSSFDKSIRLWAIPSGKFLRSLEKHTDLTTGLSFNNEGRILVSGGYDKTLNVWDVSSGRLIVSLEGHLGFVSDVAFLPEGCLIASRSSGEERTIHLWRTDTWSHITSFPELTRERYWPPGIVFHPWLPILATVGSDPGTPREKRDYVIHVWELDLDILLGKPTGQTITYTSSKVVLVGDSGVGKTGLGWRLAHGKFKEHSSTHGQQFWLLNQLCKQRDDGTQCEAVLWDLAGQPDYRLIHALFLDDADLALVLFDPTRDDDPLNGVEFWLKQLKVEVQSPNGTPTFLIAARSDRGTPRLTLEELNTFCEQRGIKAYIVTSAKSGEGIEDLVKQMQNMIPWDEKPATITTETFKRIKDFVLDLKEKTRRRKMILTPKELRQRLEKTDRKWKFSNAEMMTAVGHLENHGYVKRLKTSQGESRILLSPELLNNLAASFILEARRNQEGLGSLEEQQLLTGEYKFPELEKLNKAEKDILLDSGAVLFLEHNICFRESNPLNNRAYLVFPELINMKKPLTGDDISIEDGVAYTVSGAVENVYASLVVLMGYTQTFTRTNHWQNHARYEMGKGLVCGFRLEEERAGELDFVLYFGKNTPSPIRTLFQGLFESFLARRNLTIRRFEPVVCPRKGHTLNRAVIRELISGGEEFAFCSRCGEKLTLPKADQPIHLSEDDEKRVKENRLEADQRSRFEQILFRLKSYVIDQEITSPECFISYAWGDPKQELWVERNLAADLQKAGITVVLDKWENSRIGASVPRFVERVKKAGRVIVVGTYLYRKKYDNNETTSGFVVAAEGDLIVRRMIGTESEKENILPILLEGTDESSFPPLLQGRVYADFRKPEEYFSTALELLLSIYQISPQHLVSIELRELLEAERNPNFSRLTDTGKRNK